MDVFGDHGQLVGRAKQERSVNAEDGGVVGNVFVLQDVDAAVFDIVVGDLRDGGGVGDAADEEQSGEDHSGFDGDGEVGEDGERERDQPDADVGLGQLEELRDLAPLAHVVGHDHQNSGEHRHGNVAEPGARRTAACKAA